MQGRNENYKPTYILRLDLTQDCTGVPDHMAPARVEMLLRSLASRKETDGTIRLQGGSLIEAMYRCAVWDRVPRT